MKSFLLTTPFDTQIECYMEVYPQRRTIQIYWIEDAGVEPWETATAQVDGLTGDEVAIKNYSENTGVLQTLVEIGIIHPPHRRIPSGFVNLDVCNMNREKIAEYAEYGF